MADGTFGDTIFHEFAHVLGFGTLFDGTDFPDLIDTTNNIYTGTNALNAWRNDVGCTMGNLPIESDGGHWQEACLVDELMTPTVTSGQDEILSTVTLGAMQDLGYTIDTTLAEPYTICNVAASCSTFCPERAAATCTRRLGSTLATKPKLSEQGEAEILNMAAAHFQKHDTKRRLVESEVPHNRALSTAFSVTYKENGNYFRRTIQRRQVEHLLT